MKILIDVGGSGVKIKRSEKGELDPDVQSFKPTSREEFYSWISEMAQKGGKSSTPDIEGIAVSICGEYDYGKEEVLTCGQYPFLIGRLRDDLEEKFDCWNVHIVNDGDAHALALKAEYAKEGLLCPMSPMSAVNLSLGTAVGFGILDWKGDLLHTCQGHNWEPGNWQCDTRENTKDLYWVLGSPGLRSLEEQHGSPDAYILYGRRLCRFLGRDLVPLFRPKIIGLSGGIVAGHYQEIDEGIRLECEESHYRESGKPLDGVVIHLSHEKDSVMLGLAELLEGNAMKILFRRLGKCFRRFGKWLTMKGDDMSATSEEPMDDGGLNTVFLAGCFSSNKEWSWRASDDELVAAICSDHGEISEARFSDLIAADGAFSRAPHAWRELCRRHGEALARRLVFEKPPDCTSCEVKVPENRSCAIVGVNTGKVVCAENGGDGPLVANRRICLGAWEAFTVLKNDDGSFSMKSLANGKFVSANPDQGGILIAQGSQVDAWERFDIRDVPDKPGVFRIWSCVMQKYVSVDETAGNILIANSDNADTWEEFRFFNETAS